MVKLLLICSAGVAAHDFAAYMDKFEKVYNGDDEYAARKAIYEENMKYIDAENVKGNTFTFGETQFTDLTNDEFKTLYASGYKAPEEMLGELPYLGEHDVVDEVAASVNWTKNGAVTPVKNQGSCGSCWSFSTTGGLEGAWQVSTGSLVSVSEQQFVDCDRAVNKGCGGGSMALAFMWAKFKDLCTEASYPYTAQNGNCTSSCTTAIPHGGVTGYKSVGSVLFGANKAQLQSALQQHPVSISVDASTFQHYTGGILSGNPCPFPCTKRNHGVLAAGYDSSAGYWLVKNSWGAGWGENGYVRITDSGNECGLLSAPTYPTVSASVSV